MSERRRRLVIRARAKVNLGLEVLGRRQDGYHELLTLLSAVDLADRVTLETTEPGPEGLDVRCDVPGVSSGPDNLAWRAADLLRREAPQGAAGVRIRIRKAIPVAAGLGGGSADAAAVVWGLDALWGLRLPRRRLAALAAELGMDVPFFLGDGAALGRERGERLTPVAPPPRLAMVLVNPGFPLATREVYGRLRPEDFTDGTRVRELVAALRGGAAAIAPRLVNGLEAAAARLWPGLFEVKAALLGAGALGVVLAGSGPTVLGIARSAAAAVRIRTGLADRAWGVWVTRTSSGPPLSVAPGPGAALARWGVAKR